LELYPEFQVVGQAATEDEAVALIKRVKPNLATVDIALKVGDGVSLLRAIKQCSPQTKSLVVTGFQERLYAERCLRAGAVGFLNKQDSSEHLIEALRTILSGKRYISSSLAEHLLTISLDGNKETEDPITRLSTRELEVFRLIGEGMSSGSIADQLFLSTHTIDTHRENIKRKLGITSAPELARHAVTWLLSQK
jgi:DNA-binding NarL/FixJ family response regulator